jgi:hypothetical protein
MAVRVFEIEPRKAGSVHIARELGDVAERQCVPRAALDHLPPCYSYSLLFFLFLMSMEA